MFPSVSVTVHVCTPVSFEVRTLLLILWNVLSLEKQLLHVDDHSYVTVPVAPWAWQVRVTEEAGWWYE